MANIWRRKPSGRLTATSLIKTGASNGNGIAGSLIAQQFFEPATATKLYFRNTQTNGIGATYYDLIPEAGSSADTAVVNTTIAGTEIQFTKTAGGALVNFITGRAPIGGFTLTSTGISAWAKESSLLNNVGLRYRVFKRASGGTETELGGGAYDNGAEITDVDAEYTWTGNVTDTAFAEDDRLLIKVYVVNVGVMAVGTATLTFNAADAATGDSFLNITPSVTFKAESGGAGTIYGLLQRIEQGIITQTAAGLGGILQE